MPSVPLEGGSLSTRSNALPDYKIDAGTGCWEWQKGRSALGYGKGSFKSVGIKTAWAHRAYYIAANGPVPPFPAAVIDHLCRNPGCVNPAHLEAVVPSRNSKRGDTAKLTDEQVAEIRERLTTTETMTDMARDYDVNEDTIWTIASGIAWREDYTAPPRPIRPEVYCRECGGLIVEGNRHKTFCCATHRQRYNQRRRYADRAAPPRERSDG